jgi:hypothetical protein
LEIKMLRNWEEAYEVYEKTPVCSFSPQKRQEDADSEISVIFRERGAD